MRLLFTGGGGAGSLSLYEQLSARHTVFFSDTDPNRVHPEIPRSQVIQSLPITSPDFAPSAISFCNSYQIDLVLPGIDEELTIWLSLIYEEITGKVLLPSLAFIQTHLDKLISSEFLASRGLSAPLTQLASEPVGITGNLILKPRSGRGSRNVYTIKDASSVPYILKNINACAEDFILQQLIHGTEYTVGICADYNGKLKAVVPLRIISKKGVTISSVSHDDREIIEYAVNLHNAFPTPGYYNIQLIKAESGGVYPFEINPRISTTTCLVLATGIDPIEAFLDLNHGHKGDSLMEFKSGVRLDRYLQTFLSRP